MIASFFGVAAFGFAVAWYHEYRRSEWWRQKAHEALDDRIAAEMEHQRAMLAIARKP